jgi:glycerol-3-phosphate O-acyltransferase
LSYSRGVAAPDEITQAVLAREEIARYLEGSHGESGRAARERIHTYLEELRTTQRYSIYRALKHPLYPILRKIERCAENVEAPKSATRAGRVVYASNHKSHIDYLVEPLVLDDNGIRPPIIAAGINLFGGPLGLLHRYVTGAIPIRRNTKDPAYLITLKAYVAEVLRKHDLFFYPEGGRSYSGELKSPKTGLMHAALQAEHPHMVILPTAVAYDLVLEDHVLARQRVKRSQRRFSRELAEMVRYAVGYRSRAFVTFGKPIQVDDIDTTSRRAILDLTHAVMSAIGRLHKVLPTAVVAAAMRPSITRRELQARADAVLETLRAAGANLGVTTGEAAVESAIEPLEARGILVSERSRVRVRDRNVLRYYARTLDHLLASPSRRTH